MGQLIAVDEDFDAPGLAWRPGEQPLALQREDHVVHRGRRDPEEPLDVGLRWRAAVHFRVAVDEGEVLALLRGELDGHSPSGWTSVSPDDLVPALGVSTRPVRELS